jgi:steroid 5-alpha reductase family enzyme
MFAMGVFFHYAADMQKYAYLTLNPGNLITDGLMAKCRNTNYFGELLIYLSFALMTQHWIPLVVLATFMAIIWLPNMRRKDKSLSRYPEYAEYKKRSSLLIPFLW